ncbi:hypothetical protein Tco_0347063 [Tanacetum coccineum]
MVRSQRYQKRPYERVEHWMDNTIAFSSVPCYQLIDFLVVTDAMIEGFKVRRIYVDGDSSSEIMYEYCVEAYLRGPLGLGKLASNVRIVWFSFGSFGSVSFSSSAESKNVVQL